MPLVPRLFRNLSERFSLVEARSLVLPSFEESFPQLMLLRPEAFCRLSLSHLS